MSNNPNAPRFASLTGAHGDLILSTDELGHDSEFWLTGLDGFYGGVGVNSNDTARKLSHGMVPEAATRTGRTLTLRAWMLFDDDATRSIADRFLSGLLWDGKQGTLAVTVQNQTLTTQVRLDGEIKHSYDGMRAINFEVPLFAADPFLYGEPIVYQAFPAGSGVGLRYPLYAAEPKGALFYGQQAPRYVGATNEGNAAAHPTYTIQGEWSSGVRITSNDGKVIEYPYPITTTSPITIDCARGACLIEGRDASNRLSARQWHTIPPRSGFLPLIEALAPATGWVDITVKDTYI